MADIQPTVVPIGEKDDSVLRITWTPVTEADACVGIARPEYSDRSIQVIGTFGGASVALHGSNDGGDTYAALNDPTGTAIAITSAKIKAVLENTEYIKPVATSGSGQELTIVVVCKKGVRARNG